jgi:hypothetical protein
LGHLVCRRRGTGLPRSPCKCQRSLGYPGVRAEAQADWAAWLCEGRHAGPTASHFVRRLPWNTEHNGKFCGRRESFRPACLNGSHNMGSLGDWLYLLVQGGSDQSLPGNLCLLSRVRASLTAWKGSSFKVVGMDALLSFRSATALFSGSTKTLFRRLLGRTEAWKLGVDYLS